MKATGRPDGARRRLLDGFAAAVSAAWVMPAAKLLTGSLASRAALGPIAAASLAACADKGDWPEGMAAFKWDRDTCARCGMIISDRRFAAQIRGGPKQIAFKFDDIGCATTWLVEKRAIHPWMEDAATRFWVAEYASQGRVWLDAHQAHYLRGKTSPMGYNFAAYAQAQPDTIAYAPMHEATSNTWPANCEPSRAAGPTASAGAVK